MMTTVPAVITITVYLSMTGGGAAQRILEISSAMHDLLKSVILPQKIFASASQKVQALAAGDACPVTSSLSIEDNSFESTGCYLSTTFNFDLLQHMYTETGVEPSNNGTGWDQRIVVGMLGSPSMSSSTSTIQWTSSYSSTECHEVWKADGECDWNNNNADCDYDGGDCCECTCVDNDFYCGDGYFDCVDPSAPCVNDDDHDDSISHYVYTGPCEVPSWNADGMCDWGNNNAGCDFDGGDCCECTCVDGDYNCSEGQYMCLDPSAPCVNDDDHDYNTAHDDYTGPCEVLSWQADGICDGGNNNAGCDFDGGDCCECTCVDSDYYNCSDEWFNCIDPSAPCVNDDDHDYADNANECEWSSWKADGICDWGNNNAGCDYDGGDCCECTCVDSYFNCGDGFFDCVDPNAPCVDDEDYSYGGYEHYSFESPGSSPSSTEMFWVNMYLPPFTEVTEGLLAQMTYMCLSSSVEIGSHPANAASWSCATLDESSSGSDAVFEEMPASLFSAQCGCNGTDFSSGLSRGNSRNRVPADDSSTTSEGVEVSSLSSSSSSSPGCDGYSQKADGECNAGNNNAECDYDGGDCCECTCIDTEGFTCGNFDCIDPNALCADDDASDDDVSAQNEDSSATKMVTNSAIFVFANMLIAAILSVVLVL